MPPYPGRPHTDPQPPLTSTDCTHNTDFTDTCCRPCWSDTSPDLMRFQRIHSRRSVYTRWGRPFVSQSSWWFFFGAIVGPRISVTLTLVIFIKTRQQNHQLTSRGLADCLSKLRWEVMKRWRLFIILAEHFVVAVLLLNKQHEAEILLEISTRH